MHVTLARYDKASAKNAVRVAKTPGPFQQLAVREQDWRSLSPRERPRERCLSFGDVALIFQIERTL